MDRCDMLWLDRQLAAEAFRGGYVMTSVRHRRTRSRPARQFRHWVGQDGRGAEVNGDLVPGPGGPLDWVPR